MRFGKPRTYTLLISLLLLLLVYPVLEQHSGGLPVLSALYSVFLCLAVYSLHDNRRVLWMALGLGLPSFVLEWLGTVVPGLPGWVRSLGLFSEVLFTFVVAGGLLTGVFRKKDVDLEGLSAALSVYLILGFGWVKLYEWLEFLHAGSFHKPGGDPMQWSDFVFFSFVTLTTLGYGDILPQTPQARALAVLEAVCGVLYLAVFVARMVSLFNATDKEE